MGGASRRKGANGELEVRDILKRFGFEAKRGQFPPFGDLEHNVPGVHIEVKRQETWALRKWLKQAEADTREGETPWVVFRGNHEPWRVVMPLEAALALAKNQRRGRIVHGDAE